MGIMFERKNGGLRKAAREHDKRKLHTQHAPHAAPHFLQDPQNKLSRFATPKYRPPHLKVCPECGRIIDIQTDNTAFARHMNHDHPEYSWVRGRYRKTEIQVKKK